REVLNVEAKTPRAVLLLFLQRSGSRRMEGFPPSISTRMMLALNTCTSSVQTYLDLAIAGERGAEAADHLRKEKLSWQT
ncbi:hypothetical protein NZA98_07735, partial [Escherichia coli]|nr:hypothetical protein [Escherichia coli]